MVDTSSKDVLRRRLAEQQSYIEKVNEQLAAITRIATLAVHRLGGTMRIRDAEWMSAEGSDMQWRTLRPPGFDPEIHVAVTLQGEAIALPGPTSTPGPTPTHEDGIAQNGNGTKRPH